MLLKTKLMIGMGALILIMGTLLAFGYKKMAVLKTERNQAIKFDLARQDTLETYKNKLGITIARAEIQDLTNRNLRKLQEDERLFWIKQFETVNNRLNNVEQASRFTATIVGNFKIPLRDTTIVVNDSTFTVRTFDNHDQWLRVSGVVTPDTIEVIPNVKIDIQSVLVWQRRKFLGLRIGKKEYFAEAKTDNPYATITGMEITKIGRKRD